MVLRPNKLVKPFGPTTNFTLDFALVRGFTTIRTVFPWGFMLVLFHIFKGTVVGDTWCLLTCFWQIILAALSSWKLTSCSFTVKLALFLIVYSYEPVVIIIFITILELRFCMYLLAFGLEMISTFTIVSRLPPSRTFLCTFLMLVAIEVTVNFHTFTAFLCISVVRFLNVRDSWIWLLSHFCSLLSMNWRGLSCL